VKDEQDCKEEFDFDIRTSVGRLSIAGHEPKQQPEPRNKDECERRNKWRRQANQSQKSDTKQTVFGCKLINDSERVFLGEQSH
jgi:hypothetical protein